MNCASLQVVTLNPGAIIGDITVLASVRERTASIIAQTDLVTFKISRAMFLRRVPPDQLEVRSTCGARGCMLIKPWCRGALEGLPASTHRCEEWTDKIAGTWCYQLNLQQLEMDG
jgi:syndecan 1